VFDAPPVQEIPLPETKFAATAEEKALILSTLKLEEFIRNSCYHLEPDVPKKSTVNKPVIDPHFLFPRNLIHCFSIPSHYLVIYGL
jgi:hypothetical protein